MVWQLAGVQAVGNVASASLVVSSDSLFDACIMNVGTITKKHKPEDLVSLANRSRKTWFVSISLTAPKTRRQKNGKQ
jgi:hypothetical protein